MKKLSILLCLVLLFSTLAFAEETIKIGGLSPLTGDVAVYGNAIKEGVDLYVEEINAKGGVLGKKVEILWQDNKGDVTEATNAYNKLVSQDGVLAILGDATSKCSIAVAGLAVEDGIPMITPTSTAVEVTQGKPNVFRACFMDDFQARVIANYAKDKLGLERIAVIYDNGDDFAVGISEAFKAQVEKNGQKIVAYESGSANDVDFKAQLTNIKAADPQALFIGFYYREASNIIKQLKEVGLNDIIILSSDGMNGIETMFPDDSYNDLLAKLYYPDHFATDADIEAVKVFNESFQKKYGKMPYNAFNATAYDATKILLDAIEKAGTTDAEAVVAAMKATDADGVTGRITFDENNNPIKSAFIMNIENGKEVYRDIQHP